jgi:hypothetical protein
VTERLRVVPKNPGVPLPRGPLLTAEQVADECFSGTVKPKWVRENVPGKMTFGHSTVRWYRDDVLAYIESRKESAA